jgi:hypothetical protein
LATAAGSLVSFGALASRSRISLEAFGIIILPFELCKIIERRFTFRVKSLKVEHESVIVPFGEATERALEHRI